jgi:hypothetical protein
MSNDENQPVSPAPAAPAYAAAPPPPRRGRLLLAGGALGIALVAGTGGFALGHVTADDGRDDHARFGRSGDFPGGPQGSFPGGPQGRPGMPPGLQDRRDDDT